MTSTVDIQFQQATLTSNNCTIAVSNGSIMLSSNQFLTFEGSVPFENLSIGSGAIVINNNTPGAAINGSVAFPLELGNAGGDPTLTINNFSGSAIVSWPSTSGPQYQIASSGDPLTLTGFTG